MGLTVSSMASDYYSLYALQNSDSYEKNKVDESEVSANIYNISSLTNALDDLNNAGTMDYCTIGNVSSYAKNSMKLSQSSVYKELSDSADTGISSLLTNSTDTSSIYSNLSTLSTLTSDYLESISETVDTTQTSSYISSYESYLQNNSAGSILNIKV